MPRFLKDIGEFEFIRQIAQRLSRRVGTLVGVGDDAAVVRFNAKEDLLFTTDMLVEGVHFTRQMAPQDVGHKAMASNISDIAAMGGRPTFAVVSIGLPPKLSLRYIQGLYFGLNRTARKFQAGIIGGDTVRSKKIIINVALLGTVAKGKAVKRSGAKAGDQIFLTGALGGSFKTGRHLTFTPRLKEAQYLIRNFPPTAMIDVSDGLAADLGHVLEQSQVGALLYADQIPRHPQVSLQAALSAGEDFELIFTLSSRTAKKFLKLKHPLCRFYWIGEIVLARNGLQLVDEQGNKTRIEPRGYRHF